MSGGVACGVRENTATNLVPQSTLELRVSIRRRMESALAFLASECLQRPHS